jgi:hypothetical protein
MFNFFYWLRIEIILNFQLNVNFSVHLKCGTVWMNCRIHQALLAQFSLLAEHFIGKLAVQDYVSRVGEYQPWLTRNWFSEILTVNNYVKKSNKDIFFKIKFYFKF